MTSTIGPSASLWQHLETIDLVDLPITGLGLSTTFLAPAVWPQPSAPSVLLEVSLPDQDGQVSYQEVNLAVAQGVEGASAMRRPPSSAVGSREFLRGKQGNVPFPIGGDALPPVSTSASRAAEEARTGAWLRDLQGPGPPPRVLAPGLDHGIFGAWAQEDYEEAERPSTAAGDSARASQTVYGAGRDQDEQASLASPFIQAGNGELSGMEDLDDDVPFPSSAGAGAQVEAAVEVAARAPALQRVQAGGLLAGQDSSSSIQPETPNRKKRRAQGQKRQWAVQHPVKDVAAEFEKIRPSMALTFPFELDDFQKEAVCLLEENKSVFVHAHTSAGKTVVAEYAFALATQHCTRAVYTSPIKTISNQKFRDFSGQFEVGLLTGDVSIKPESPCLIMTTEILRSMLYKGADVIRDIEWVVFDEVHYVNDQERGVVWEEVIIMLPAHVNLVLLSATVPNVMDFADWVGRTKRKVVYVTGTAKRPVPLEHSLYYRGEMYPVAGENGMIPSGITAAKAAHKAQNAPPETRKDVKAARPTGRGNDPVRGGRGGGPAGRQGGGRGRQSSSKGSNKEGHGKSSGGDYQSDKAKWTLLIKTLEKKEMLPMVVFAFSKKKVDYFGSQLGSLNFCTGAEKAHIHGFCDRALARLHPNDRTLPQVQRVRELLERGLGVHHAGLLPIMKEVVEMLFCQGVIRVLFSTETFAMGVNAPARTVVFAMLRKFDGGDFRYLLPGEYTQMAGRAGRRGKDTVGSVLIACFEDIPDESDLRRMLVGKPAQLQSQFRLTYSMILNLLRVEDLTVEDMLKRSFAESRAQLAAPETLKEIAATEEQLSAIQQEPWPGEGQGLDTPREQVEAFHEACVRIGDIMCILHEHEKGCSASLAKVLVPGQLILLRDPTSGFPTPAVIAGVLSPKTAKTSAAREYVVLCLHQSTPLDALSVVSVVEKGMRMTPFHLPPSITLQGGSFGGRGGNPIMGPIPRRGTACGSDFLLQQVQLANVEAVARSRPLPDGERLLDGNDAEALHSAIQYLQANHPADVAWQHLAEDLKIRALSAVNEVEEYHQLLQERALMAAWQDPVMGAMWGRVRREWQLGNRLAEMHHKVSDASLQQLPEFQQRLGVMRALGYVDAQDTVQMKGRVACEIASGDELIATEIIFSGILTALSPAEAAALLSALVFQEKTDEDEADAPTEALEEARAQCVAVAMAAGRTQQEHGMQMLAEDFVADKLKWGLVGVVYEWACGTAFGDICTQTSVMEGSIVRCIVRLSEATREVGAAARVMGDTALWNQMEEASTLIKRDVVFAASLYLA
ncbi:hypothetical protein WJX73_006832 [Symbiochloris irregularis]|uniref:Antiviral helicase SKI2 n=1 Tax=Symbiochloris irregularis TaxID=706552 RepID=A0AAW1P0S7_9CHLO